ncbi:MAG: hypothetical protein R2844_06575 [Caldilineales bacterium]
MEETAHDIRTADTLEAWQHALVEVPTTPAMSGVLLRRKADLFGRFSVWYERLRSRPQAERRRLQRRFGLSLAGVALLLSLNGSATGASSPAATIVVDGTTCTLVDAITAANTNTATGGCVAGDPGADTIDLQVNVTLTAVNNETYGDTGLPVATSTITIAGNGHTVSRQTGLPDFRIFAVGTGGNLTLNSTTVSGGIAADSSLTNRDGGVYNRNMLTVENSTLLENITAHGGGIINNRGTVTVLNSSLSGNTAARGGGIANNRGTVTVLNSSLSGNLANRYGGGGIHSYSGWLTLQDSTLSGNTADSQADSLVVAPSPATAAVYRSRMPLFPAILHPLAAEALTAIIARCCWYRIALSPTTLPAEEGAASTIMATSGPCNTVPYLATRPPTAAVSGVEVAGRPWFRTAPSPTTLPTQVEAS